MLTNFIIPTNIEDIFRRSQDVVKKQSNTEIPLKLQDAKSSLLRGGAIDEKHFDVFCNVISRFSDLDIVIKQQAWKLVKKACGSYADFLGSVLNNAEDQSAGTQLDATDKHTYRNTLKRTVYVLTQMAQQFQSATRAAASAELTNPGRGRKKTTSSSSNADNLNWEDECTNALQLMLNTFDLDIYRLWEGQIVEDELPALVTSFCYNVLEDPSIMRSKTVKSAVVHLLGCIIKKHNQSLSTAMKLTQMLQHFDHLATPLAEAVQIWTDTYKCRMLVAEVLRELSHIPEKDLIRDGTSTKTISTFVSELGRLLPGSVLVNMSLLVGRMGEEAYLMRNAVLDVFRDVLINCLSCEGLEEKAKDDRDQLLEMIMEHANVDMNAFVRSRAVNVLSALVNKEAVPIKCYPDVLDIATGLLLDKSNLVRKSTVQLLESMLRWNPFTAKLQSKKLKESLSVETEKLEQLHISKDIGKEAPATGGEDGEAREQEETNPPAPEEQTPDNVEANEPMVTDVVEDAAVAKQKDVVSYLTMAVGFVEKLENAVPVLCQLTRSQYQTDVLEAINFFTTAWEFQMNFAMTGITAMLDQIWNEDQKIRDAVVSAYKDFYFKQSTDSSASHTSQVVDNMIALVAGSSKSKLKTVESLIVEMRKSNDIPAGVFQILWNRLNESANMTSQEDSNQRLNHQKVIIQLLGILASENPSLLRGKVDQLVDVGLKMVTSSSTTSMTSSYDFDLAHETCVALSNLSSNGRGEAGKYKKKIRFSNDHKVIDSLMRLILEGYGKESTNYSGFAMKAVGIVFDLAQYPVLLSTRIFNSCKNHLLEHKSKLDESRRNELFVRFFNIIGELALKMLIFVDCDVQSEIKNRRKLEEEKEQADENKKKKKKKKRSSVGSTISKQEEGNLEEDMGVGGATADDADQDFVTNILENEIVAPGTLLGSAAGMLVRTCSVDISPTDRAGVRVQASASLALSKYMMTSSKFCEDHLRLLFTMLEKSPHENIRANLAIAASDLCIRFPNLMEPWNSNIYGRLNDPSVLVRTYAIRVLTNLILNDMIKVKGHVSEIARCVVDDEDQISVVAKKFFQELSRKGNSLYNVIPDIISRLSSPEVELPDEGDYKVIMKFLFEFIQKDKQAESLVEKLCHRFKATRDVQQWRDLAYCLTLLSYSERGFKRLNENFSFYADILGDEEVFCSFSAVLTKIKKTAKPETKIQVEELEGKIMDRHAQGVSDLETAEKAARASNKLEPQTPVAYHAPDRRKGMAASTRKTRRTRKTQESWSSGEEEEAPAEVAPASVRKSERGKKKCIVFSDSESDNDEEEETVKENIEVPLIAAEELNTADSTPIRRTKQKKRRSLLRT